MKKIKVEIKNPNISDNKKSLENFLIMRGTLKKPKKQKV